MNTKKESIDELDEITQIEDSETDLLAKMSEKDVVAMHQEISIDINNLCMAVTSFGKRLDNFEKAIEKTKTTTDALASLSLQNRKLQEKFHEREVLQPLFLSLINIVFRAQEQIARFRKHKEESAGLLKLAAEKAFNFMIKVREADIVEIHNMLAIHGIEPFMTEEDIFDPSKQKAIQRIETQDEALSQKIASRLHPGYSRGDQIIQREYVSVYYLKS